MIIFTNLNIVNRKAFERTKDEHLTKSEGIGEGEEKGLGNGSLMRNEVI